MIFKLLLLLSSFSFCFAQASPVSRAAFRVSRVLSPYVRELDREAYVFRWERASEFSPSSLADVRLRLETWASRFSAVDVRSGADTGPGLYVATDPSATSTWGGDLPRLYSLRLRAGSRVLVGDQWETPRPVALILKRVAQQLRCESSSTQLDFDIGHAVGYFRMNPVLRCRQMIIEVMRRLKVQAISYSFNSVNLPACRNTGTAISIIDFSSLSSGINAYAESKNFEGEPAATPFIRRLYDEGKFDYYTQTLLADIRTWPRYLNGFGFFQSPLADDTTYAAWKAEHVLKCGRPWSVESPNAEALAIMSARANPDPQIAELLIKMSLLYRERFLKHATAEQFQKLAFEFDVARLVRIKNRDKDLTQNYREYELAHVPHWPGSARREYVDILNDCLQLYADLSNDFAEVLRGECRVERE